MSNVVNLPVYPATNLVESLRKLAREIETGDVDALRCVVAIETSEGDGTYRAFGETFTRAHAVGLLAYAGKMIYDF